MRFYTNEKKYLFMKIFFNQINPKLLEDKFKMLIYSSLRPKFPCDFKLELECIERINDELKKNFSGDQTDLCFWRSVAQYKAHAFYRSKLSLFLVNFFSIFGILLIPIFFRSKICPIKNKIICKYIKYDFHPAYIVPNSIKSETVEVNLNCRYLRFGDFQFACKLFFKHRVFNSELLLRFLWWVSRVRPVLDKYNPEFVLQYCEYSPHSSLRKAFLNNNGVKLSNITHGEEYLSTRSAFSTFDQYYYWFITDALIHSSMKIKSDNWISFNPSENHKPALLPDKYVVGVLWPSIMSVDLELLIVEINKISSKYKVIVRPHPSPLFRNRFECYVDQLNAEVSYSTIEDAHTFIDRTSVICGYTSALMIQAALRGRRVVYIEDGYLESLFQYHSYYKNVEHVSLCDLHGVNFN